MIEGLKPYAEYEESEVPWIGKIPQHWRILPNRALLKLKKKSVGVTSEDYTLLSLTKQGIIPRDLENPSGKFPANFETYQIVEPGDLIFCLFDIDETPRAVGLSNLQGMITGAYTRFVCNDPSYTRFVYLFYLAMDNGKLLKPLYSGLRKVITKSTFLSAKTPFPPQEEQAAIVRFLDHANRKIDHFIRDKRRLIKLLNEQKHAIIHRAVTRGLDPNVRLKPSGIEWLGDIPMHWEVRRLKALARFVTSGSRGWAKYYSDTGPVFLRIGNISTKSVDLKLNRITHVLPPIDAEGERTRVQEDDVLLSITAQIGAVGIVPLGFGEAYVNQHTALIRLKSTECHQRWVAYCLLSEFGKRQCQLLKKKKKKVGLTLDDVRTIRVLMPPKSEQATIVVHIEALTRDLNTAIARTEREITLLREYRARLVADVVTGKLDVRGVELPAMNEVETVEDMDTYEDTETEAEELIESEEVADADE